jgi:hypothetical protein
LLPTAFAPEDCESDGEYCSEFQCVTPPPIPEVAPQPLPVRPHPIIQVNSFLSAGAAGDYCESDAQCMGAYCDTTKHQCVEKNGFAQSCPKTCTSDNQCLEGNCIGGSCVHQGYKKEVGGKCTGNEECFSGSCVSGSCTGTDCSNFKCENDGYFCDYDPLSTPKPNQPTCYPNWQTFIDSCPLETNYAVRADVQLVNCVPKKAAGQSCTQNYECFNFCSGGFCTAYDKFSIPAGKPCTVSFQKVGLCADGLYCSASGTCMTIGKEGDNCASFSDCGTGLICSTGLKCAKPGKEGASCLSISYCEEGLICNTSLKCAPLGQEGASCVKTETQYCVTGLVCNGATLKCSQLGKEGDDCSVSKECTTGLICNSNTKKCSQLGVEGDACLVTSECSTDYICLQNPNLTLTCTKSPTIGKSCAWDATGKHNCSYQIYGEMCVCYDGGPKCVGVTSEAYLTKLQSYVPKPPVIPEPEPEPDYEELKIKPQACMGSIFTPDPSIIYSSALDRSYISFKIGCTHPNTWWLDEKCRSLFARSMCCNMCYLDQLSVQMEFDSDTVFYSSQLGPYTKLTCGDNPQIEFNPDSCEGPQYLSWDEIMSRYSCAGKSYSYGKISITVVGFSNTFTNQDTIKLLIEKQLDSEGLPLPVSTSFKTDEDGNTVVTLIYIGSASNGDNVSRVGDSLSSQEFSDSVSNSIQGSSVSDVSAVHGSASRHILSMIALIVFVLIGLLF